MVGLTVAGNESGIYPLTPVNDRKEREVDLGEARGDLTNQRKNLPINLVLKEGVTIEDLGQRNYIVQMRLTDTKGVRVYSYAPKGTSMDYSTYTKTTSVSLEDKVNRLFIKGGYQKDGKNATAQESFMSEFIANPDQYEDKSNLGIIRTQYTGQRAGNDKIPTVGGEQIAFTQAFDANLLNYLKPDKDGNVAYVNVFKNTRLKSKWSHNVGIKLKDFNKTADGNLAYLVIGTHDFQKDDVKKVEVTDHDQYTMIQGYYITGIDYVVDKSKFEDTFAGRDDLSGGNKTRKLDYSMISGWTNPNTDGWVVYEKEYDSGYTAQEGESYIIDTTSDPTGGQIMLQIGNEDAIIRKQQGYYSYYITSDKGIEKIEKFADGIFKFDLREGATVKSGDKLKIFMPYTKDHKDPVNFLEIHNGTKINEGGATLKLQKDRNINMHLYKEGKKGYYILKYTLADGTKAEKKFEPKGLWKFDNKDRVMDPGTNGSILSSGGNFYINTKKLTPGADIIVESYDENDNKLEDQTSWFKYRTIEKSTERVKELTWTDSSDTSSILSVNKSLYTPYQLLFTNDYAEGTDDFYKDPKALPANNDDFKKDTKEFVGYTKYDGGKVRTLYEEGKIGKLFAKVQAAENEYDDKGNLVGEDVSKKITIPKANIFDPHFAGDNKEYRAYEYKVDLTKMLPYHSEDKTETPLTLLKDMKFVSTASDGSSLPSDLLETRVRARVLFDANTGKLADGKDKEVKIVPDNTKFYGEEGYAANGFEGANVEANTGDKFPEAPTLAGKNFLGWVTEAGKTALGDKAVVTADAFAKLSKDQIFTNETPVTKHLVVYAIYSEDVAVTFDANQGKFGDKDQVTVKVEGGNATAPTENPTREGYTFKGWAATKDATEADANILNNVTAAKTVYAVWEKTAEELQLNDPTPVEVKDTKNLTSDEKDKVADAVIAANSTLTKADITVADDGTVTVKTKDGKTATLSPEKTVKQKEVQNNFNPPKEPVKVENAKALTDTEKQAVKEAIKEANPDRNFTDEDITVNDDGSVKINQGGKVGSFTPDQTVVQKDTILDLTAPEKTEVKDTTNLTQEERDKVAAAVKAKNSLPDTATIVVDNNGNVKVTDGTKTGKLEGKDTVKPFDRAGKTLNDPAITTVSNPAKLTDAEKRAVKDAVMAANKDLGFTYEEIKVADDGTVTVPMGKDENKTIEPAKTVRQATAEDKIIALKAPEKTEVVDKTNLTDDEKAAVKKAVEDANKDGSGNSTLPAGATITVANDGSVTVTQGEGENKKVGQLSQNDTVIEKIKAPTTPVEVADPSHLTDDEKEAVKKAVKDANPKLPADAKVTVGNDGSVTVTDKDGKEIGTLTPAQTVKKAGETDTTAPAAPKVKANEDGSVTVTPPTDADTKEVEVTYVPTGKTEPVKVTATKDPETGKWSVPDGSDVTVDSDTGVITVPADKVADGTEVSAVAKDNSGNASTPTDESKATAKTPGEDKVKAPVTPVEVKDPSKLTPEEKKAVEDAVKEANPNLPQGANIDVADDGTVTVTDKDGNEIGKLTPAKTVKKASTPAIDEKDTVDDSKKKPVEPTDDAQRTGVVVKNPDKVTSITAKDEDGKDVPVAINPTTGEIIVTPGANVDGPIVVTIINPDLPKGKTTVIINVNGHSMLRDDNGNGYPGDDWYYFPRRPRREIVPTFPVYAEAEKKVTPVHDTLWYVFHINEYQYEVVRNGVVTKRIMDVTPVIQNDRTMLPLRYVAEALGADVQWDAKTRTARFTKDGLTASIQIDSDEIVLSNGKTIKMDSKPLNIKDRILVSVTNVANVFGMTNGHTLDSTDQDIEWNQNDKTATIYIRR